MVTAYKLQQTNLLWQHTRFQRAIKVGLVVVWLTWTFIQGNSCERKGKLGSFSLNQFWWKIYKGITLHYISDFMPNLQVRLTSAILYYIQWPWTLLRVTRSTGSKACWIDILARSFNCSRQNFDMLKQWSLTPWYLVWAGFIFLHTSQVIKVKFWCVELEAIKFNDLVFGVSLSYSGGKTLKTLAWFQKFLNQFFFFQT